MSKILGHGLASISGDLTDIDATARNPLGYRVFDTSGNEFIYLKGVASLAAGDWVMYNAATATALFGTVRMVSTPIAGLAAVAMAATLATQFGWFQIYGLTPTYTNIATDAAADGKTLSQGATPGRAATGAVTTKNLFGTNCVGAAASNAGTAFICYPFCMASATI